MPVSSAYRPDPRLPDLGPEFADPVAAADFPQVLLRFRNDRAAATVGLDTLTDPEWVAHFWLLQSLSCPYSSWKPRKVDYLRRWR